MNSPNAGCLQLPKRILQPLAQALERFGITDFIVYGLRIDCTQYPTLISPRRMPSTWPDCVAGTRTRQLRCTRVLFLAGLSRKRDWLRVCLRSVEAKSL